eukprot:4440168-Pyramimonas_sp.AAC.1
MEFGAARWRSWGSGLAWLRSGGVFLWSTSSRGATGGLLFSAWGATVYFQAWSWAVEKMGDIRSLRMELDDFWAHLHDLYQD